MVCLGLEPWAAGWKVQTNPLSYGSTPKTSNCYKVIPLFISPPHHEFDPVCS